MKLKEILNQIKTYSYQPTKEIQDEVDWNKDKHFLNEIEKENIKKLLKLIEDIESDSNCYLALRGQGLEHAELMTLTTTNIHKYFVVGQKARTHMIEETPKKYSQTTNKNETEEDIIKLISKSNNLLKQISKKNPEIKGQFDEKSLLNNLKDMSNKEKESFKLKLLAFLHNKDYIGTKENTNFISLTKGGNKLQIARDFAIKCQNQGIIFVYIINKNKDNILSAKELKEWLKEEGIDWFEDKHEEILLLNVMYPHFMIGFFEIVDKQITRFIMNPWFYKHLLDNKGTLKDGVQVNQENFNKFKSELGYTSHITRYLANEIISRNYSEYEVQKIKIN